MTHKFLQIILNSIKMTIYFPLCELLNWIFFEGSEFQVFPPFKTLEAPVLWVSLSLVPVPISGDNGLLGEMCFPLEKRPPHNSRSADAEYFVINWIWLTERTSSEFPLRLKQLTSTADGATHLCRWSTLRGSGCSAHAAPDPCTAPHI